MDENEIYETVKEYSLSLPDLEFKIYARVSKRFKPTGHFDYMWEISHYCKQEKTAAGIYIPSATSGNTFEEAEHLLMFYMTKFAPIEVTANEYY